MDRHIEFDNNFTENAIRPTKLGHKDWMFIGGKHTSWRTAVIYTFVEQVRRHGADPFAYFEWVLEKLMQDPAPKELQALLPATWIKPRPAASETVGLHRCHSRQISDKNAKCDLLTACTLPRTN